MNAGNEIDFEKWFDRIIDKEKNLEVPINVCFGLIEQHNKNENQIVTIEQEIITKKKNELSLWKMKMQTIHS